MDMSSFVDEVTETEFRRESVSVRSPRGSKEPETEPRKLTVWIALNASLGFCTVPLHEEVQSTLSVEAKQYRDRYPTRMVHLIGEYFVCRDCFLTGADKDG